MNKQTIYALALLGIFSATACTNTSVNVPTAPPTAQQLSFKFSPNIPIGNLTQNNTSACGNSTSPCTEAFNQNQTVTYDSGIYKGQKRSVDAFWDNGVAATNQNPSAPCGTTGACQGHISKIPISTLIPGYKVPILTETQLWWGNGNGHINNGENSQLAAQTNFIMADHVSRGFAGQVLDWYGYSSNGSVIGSDDQQDIAAQNIIHNISNYQYNGSYKFALMIDKGYIDGCEAEKNSSGKLNTGAQCINDALSYMNATYFGSPYYMKDSSGSPLVFYFVNKYYLPELDILLNGGITYYGNAKFVMYEPNGFPNGNGGNSVPSHTDGEYSWVNPQDASTENVSGAQGSFAIDQSFGFQDLTSFLNVAKVNQSSLIVSEVHKGFDDNLANWSMNRIIGQDCGLTWLQTFNFTGGPPGIINKSYWSNLNYLKSGYKLDYIMQDTWDDYEEGTEIETGINNCMNSFTPSVNTTTNVLSWTPSFGKDPMSGVAGNETTLYKYVVYIQSSGGGDVQWLADVVCSNGTCPHSLALSSYGITGGPYVFYVQAVGQPSIQNTLSGASNAWNPGGGNGGCNGDVVTVHMTSPTNNETVNTTFGVSGSASSNTGSPITAMQIYWNSNMQIQINNVSSLSNFQVTMSPGTYTAFELKGWDQCGNVGMASVSITVQQQQQSAVVTAPVNNQNVSLETTVKGTASDPDGITAMQVVVNGTLYGTFPVSGSPTSLNFSEPIIFPNSGTIALQEWNTKGGTYSTPSNQQPTVSAASCGSNQLILGSPYNGQVLPSETFNVSASGCSPNIVSFLEILDGANVIWSNQFTNSPMAVWVTPSLKFAKGSHSLSLKAWDLSGNGFASSTVTMTAP